MTDVRVPSFWLSKAWYTRLTDFQLAVFVRAMQFSAENEQDGAIHSRDLRNLHPTAERDEVAAALDHLVTIERAAHTDDGWQLLRWSDEARHGGLGQTTADTLQKLRERKARNQRESRTGRATQAVDATEASTGGGGVSDESTALSKHVVTGAVTGDNTSVTGDTDGEITVRVGRGRGSKKRNSSHAGAREPHSHEPNARSALTTLVDARHLAIPVPELLEDAYALGSGDPWQGYLEVKTLTEKSMSWARDPAAALRAQIRKAAR